MGCGFRKEALLTMSKIPPIQLMIEEKLENHKGIKEKAEIKSTMLNKWEEAFYLLSRN